MGKHMWFCYSGQSGYSTGQTWMTMYGEVMGKFCVRCYFYLVEILYSTHKFTVVGSVWIKRQEEQHNLFMFLYVCVCAYTWAWESKTTRVEGGRNGCGMPGHTQLCFRAVVVAEMFVVWVVNMYTIQTSPKLYVCVESFDSLAQKFSHS